MNRCWELRSFYAPRELAEVCQQTKVDVTLLPNVDTSYVVEVTMPWGRRKHSALRRLH